jgi:hypothetical protein
MVYRNLGDLYRRLYRDRPTQNEFGRRCTAASVAAGER